MKLARELPLSIVIGLAVLTVPGQTQPVCGDCDLNGVFVTILDALAGAQIGAGITAATPAQMGVCDVNSSGDVTVIDALFMAQVAAGIPRTLICPSAGNAPPTAANCTNTEVSGDIPITYLLSDLESDVCSIRAEWSTDGGITHTMCTEQPMGSDGTTGLASSMSGIMHTFVWDSVADFGLINVPGMSIQITPRDSRDGFECVTATFTLANMPGAVPATATGCTATPPLCGGLVDIDYDLIDPDSPVVDVIVEYSLNGGSTWQAAMTQGPGSEGTMALSASAGGDAHLFVWDAAADLAPTLHNNVVVRVTPDDGILGTPCDTGVFVIDLDPGPPLPGTETGSYASPSMGIVDVWVVQDPGGTPISGASVMIGPAPDNPFVGNFGTTDASGHIRFCDLSLAGGANTITGGATGRQYVTFFETTANQVVLGLKQIEVYPPTTAVNGDMTGVTIPGCFTSADVGAGLVFPIVQATDLIGGFFGFVLGPDTCWQSGLAGDVILPGNFYIPGQTVGPVCLAGTLNQHEYILDLPTGTQQQLAGLYGVIDGLLLTGGLPGVVDLLNLIDVQEFTFGASFTPTGASQRRDTPRTAATNNNVTMTVGNAPSGFDVLGIVGGDLSGGNGDGPLAVMGVKGAGFASLMGGATVQLPTISSVPPAGVGGGSVGYLGLAAAVIIDNMSPPPGVVNALSALIDRTQTLTASGGSTTLNTFFAAPILTAPPALPGTLGMTDPGLSPPNEVDLVAHRFERVTMLAPVPLPPCAGSTMPTRSSIYWEIYARGGVTNIPLPTLPGSFPRAADAGLLDTAVSPENDTFEWTAAFIGLGGAGLPGAPSFDFDTFLVNDLPMSLTHLASNIATLP